MLHSAEIVSGVKCSAAHLFDLLKVGIGVVPEGLTDKIDEYRRTSPHIDSEGIDSVSFKFLLDIEEHSIR